jgi:putative protein kinase ArgK-like GTPase of G3E family
MPASSCSFKAAEDAKVMQIDAEDPSKTIQIGAILGLRIRSTRPPSDLEDTFNNL